MLCASSPGLERLNKLKGSVGAQSRCCSPGAHKVCSLRGNSLRDYGIFFSAIPQVVTGGGESARRHVTSPVSRFQNAPSAPPGVGTPAAGATGW